MAVPRKKQPDKKEAAPAGASKPAAPRKRVQESSAPETAERAAAPRRRNAATQAAAEPISQPAVAQWCAPSEAMSVPEPAVAIAPEDVRQLVTFMLDGEEYGFAIMQVQEVLRARFVHITPIPNAPNHVEGVMNLRGRVIPVVGLRRRFGMPEVERDRDSRVVVVEISGRAIGVSVDSVVEVTTIDASQIELLPELAATDRSEFIIGVSRAGARIVIVLDMDRVFSVEEKASLDDIVTGKREEA